MCFGRPGTIQSATREGRELPLGWLSSQALGYEVPGPGFPTWQRHQATWDWLKHALSHVLMPCGVWEPLFRVRHICMAFASASHVFIHKDGRKQRVREVQQTGKGLVGATKRERLSHPSINTNLVPVRALTQSRCLVDACAPMIRCAAGWGRAQLFTVWPAFCLFCLVKHYQPPQFLTNWNPNVFLMQSLKLRYNPHTIKYIVL